MLGLLLGADGTLFALGAMSLAWTALVARLIALEKTFRGGAPRSGPPQLSYSCFAVTLVAMPHSVPGLVVPGEPHGDTHTMSEMH